MEDYNWVYRGLLRISSTSTGSVLQSIWRTFGSELYIIWRTSIGSLVDSREYGGLVLGLLDWIIENMEGWYWIGEYTED